MVAFVNAAEGYAGPAVDVREAVMNQGQIICEGTEALADSLV